MSFEELQLAWQHDRTATPIAKMDYSTLNQVRADSRRFSRMIFWRDVREVVASLLIAFVFGSVAWAAHSEGAISWPAWISAALGLGVGVYFLIDRLIMHRRARPQGDVLCVEIDRAADSVRHQIWLLRNMFWWYMLPIILSTLFFALQVTIGTPEGTSIWVKVLIWAFVLGPSVWVDRWIWNMNQKAIRTELEPRLAELEMRRAELMG